ncbi:MAG: NDP-sugar synthase [Elusimicrobia bacterium]|nr:NDP-sugar synthase [Elusimicrobiota bacterium]MDE2236452.1 NDP-sugar synthase [Elusimicrobiota bacterium]MDE2425057.1 NDP-sugar synthase [Elusimicrobiota bacterium]
MKAVLLIGGRGTRLRPFTLQTPKPLLPLVNKPFLSYQFEVLRGHVDEVLLCAADPAPFRRALGARACGLKLTYLCEERPLGTGGAVKNAEGRLAGQACFLVLNGDVLNRLDVRALVATHRKARARVTIALTRVADPTMYGLVRAGRDGTIREFIEKPSAEETDATTINAGAYVFDRSVLAMLKPGPSSLERELFPSLLDGGGLRAHRSEGYWIDIGTIERYLDAHLDLLGGRAGFALPKTLRSLDGGRVAVGRGALIHPTARFSGNVSVGARCRIAAGAALRDCVLLEETSLGAGSRVERCVVGPRCLVGERAALLRSTAVAGGSRIKPYSQL